jgi:SNF2 family DNA or RNA helicase
MIPPKMIDNKRNGCVADELRQHIGIGSKLSIMTAYFTIFAFSALKSELLKVDQVRMLFTDPSFINDDQEPTKEYYLARNNTPAFGGSIYEIKLRNEMCQASIARECAEWFSKKVQVKMFKERNPAQPRLVHIDNSSDSMSINGTVDFTTDGLGLTPSDRIDSNMCMYGHEFTDQFLRQFDELWNDRTAVEDVKDKVLQHIQTLYQENTPEFIYFVTLYNIFNQYIGELTEDNIMKTRTGIKDSIIWNKLYQFQKDGVIGAIDKIEKYNGCIIADSVGLGKTFSALAVIKYYELQNYRVLVLSPKKLRDNWTIYTQNDTRNILAGDRFSFDVLNHTDLSRYSGTSGDHNLATVNWGNYGLVVIDESHNFRNNNPAKDRVTRYERMMNDVIKSGIKTKVLMLTATPVNNRMNDIKNQIYFITEGRDDAFSDIGIPNLEILLKKAQNIFNRWSELPDAARTTDTFVDMMSVDYFKLLDTVTIARSRKHIEKYYNLSEIGKFPKRLPPKNIYAEIDTENQFRPIGEVNQQIKRLSLALYSPLRYVLPEKRKEYEKKYDVAVADGKSVFRQADRETHLIDLMRVGMLKRMESSVNSFGLTVGKILANVESTLQLIEKNLLVYDPELQIGDIDLDDNELDDLMFGKNVKILLQDMDLIKWQQDLEDDRDKLQAILDETQIITPERDMKLQMLRDLIQQKIEKPINPSNRKIIVFTAFADTANYLYANLAPALLESGIYTALVTGSGENRSTLPIPKGMRSKIKLSDISTVLTLFSPRSKECDKVFPEVTDRIDVLIATDCISEGQNLQDCDYLINYDIHWNPVRIIQRFGRIDRIGSVNDVIQLVNFWPMRDLDEYINLQQRVQGRMVLLDVSATGEENVIDQDSSEMRDLEYRRKQLKRLQEEVVDLEDISGGISITDLTFNDFKSDLMEYLKSNRKELSGAPTGLYAVAEIDESLRDTVKPGVIFTLRQVRGREQTKEQNALFPYYLVYITDDGEVKQSFLHAKQILDYYKKLCCGKGEVLSDLVSQFNAETHDGSRMQHYSGLLNAAVENLIGKKQEIGVASLFSRGGTTLQKEFYDGLEDFELVTFLVLK